MQERELCAHHRFLPSFYLSLKAAFLREAAQRPQGAIPRSDARTLFRLEPAKAMHIYELMQRTGWLRAAPQRTRGAPTATPSESPSPLVAGPLGLTGGFEDGPGVPTGPEVSMEISAAVRSQAPAASVGRDLVGPNGGLVPVQSTQQGDHEPGAGPREPASRPSTQARLAHADASTMAAAAAGDAAATMGLDVGDAASTGLAGPGNEMHVPGARVGTQVATAAPGALPGRHTGNAVSVPGPGTEAFGAEHRHAGAATPGQNDQGDSNGADGLHAMQ